MNWDYLEECMGAWFPVMAGIILVALFSAMAYVDLKATMYTIGTLLGMVSFIFGPVLACVWYKTARDRRKGRGKE